MTPSREQFRVQAIVHARAPELHPLQMRRRRPQFRRERAAQDAVRCRRRFQKSRRAGRDLRQRHRVPKGRQFRSQRVF